jgi:hypothetical protein
MSEKSLTAQGMEGILSFSEKNPGGLEFLPRLTHDGATKLFRVYSL